MSNEALAKMIDGIAKKDFTSAEKEFNGVLNNKLQDVLDQAKVKMAGTMFEPQVAVSPDYDVVAGEVTNDDLAAAYGIETDEADPEAEAAADEVEAEVEAADDIELEDDEDEAVEEDEVESDEESE